MSAQQIVKQQATEFNYDDSEIQSVFPFVYYEETEEPMLFETANINPDKNKIHKLYDILKNQVETGKLNFLIL